MSISNPAHPAGCACNDCRYAADLTELSTPAHPMTTTHLPTVLDAATVLETPDATTLAAFLDAQCTGQHDCPAPHAAFLRLVNRIAELEAAVARRSPEGAEQRLAWIRQRCRIVFYPGDLSYPIEHTLFASKDMWDALMAEYERENPVAPTREPTP